MSVLYIVATPIGNLEDISKRALRTLSEVDLILCEDTRVTKKLLDHYQVKTSVISYHQHSKINKIEYIIGLLKDGKNLALVSDAGTPGISDPGGKLISEVYKLGFKICPIPGASAVITAASISGFPTDRFLFMGFPPQKKKRKKFFEEAVGSKYPVVFYESTYRILKTLEELKEMDSKLILIVCRELTKKFETIYRGEIGEVIKEIKKGETRGEFVVVLGGKSMIK